MFYIYSFEMDLGELGAKWLKQSLLKLVPPGPSMESPLDQFLFSEMIVSKVVKLNLIVFGCFQIS